MKLSTATRISLGFSILTILLLSFFCLTLYQLFDRGWRRSEAEILQTMPVTKSQNIWEKKSWVRNIQQRFSESILIFPDDPLYEEFMDQGKKQGIIDRGERSYMYAIKRNVIALRDVSHHIKRQKKLLDMILYAIVWATLVSFLLWKLFVKWALRDLHILTKKIENVDTDALHFGHDLDHLPEWDEIHVLANTLQQMTLELQSKIDDMKQFVAHAAHELRTPLMILRSGSDLALKTKNYIWFMPELQNTIWSMEHMISTLLLLARNDFSKQTLQRIEVRNIVDEQVENMKNKRSEKNIICKISGLDTVYIQWYIWCIDRIIANIVDNAYKYTPHNWTILIDIEQYW